MPSKAYTTLRMRERSNSVGANQNIVVIRRRSKAKGALWRWLPSAALRRRLLLTHEAASPRGGKQQLAVGNGPNTIRTLISRLTSHTSVWLLPG